MAWLLGIHFMTLVKQTKISNISLWLAIFTLPAATHLIICGPQVFIKYCRKSIRQKSLSAFEMNYTWQMIGTTT